ncbi:hypothetical protein [Deinococcus budaensis]|uniref:Uncharacterized protein n=1 Tax=Deinococcus budaensis TaxID=1665626 RepID=A0A7W8LQ81_9DEIO|nr:hypothetical protein [Deinococcus budaensis]MBB5234469.1 hypothetical protein [Deinococcus budaensis]
MTGQVDRIRARTQALLASKADLLYTASSTFSQAGLVQYGLRDLNSENAGRNAVRLATDPIPASLRVLNILPGSPRPETGESARHGQARLYVGDWTDTHPVTGIAFAVCRLVDERAYPLVATIGTVGFRLRISALGAPALSVNGGNDLQATANDSHRGHLPPGVQLQPGEVITTVGGDRYQVVPPVQRDALGDTVGLSWQGSGAGAPRPPLSPPGSPDPTPGPAPTPTPRPDGSYDPWWDEETP